ELMAAAASLMTNMPAMSFSKDAATGEYLACNQAFAEYACRATPEDIIGRTDYELFDRETADHIVADDRKAMAMDKPYIYFEDVPDAAGTMRHLQTTKLKFTDESGRLCTLGMCVDVTELSRYKAAEARQHELEERLALQEELLEKERQRARQESLITALSADYWSVYYLELDKDEGICYQSHSDVVDGFKVGEQFRYLEAVTAYANQYITDEYREEFLRFIQPDAIRAGLENQAVISYRYMVRRNGRDSYEMVRFAGVRRLGEREDHHVHTVGACFTDVDAETRQSLARNRALTEALTQAEEANRAKTAFLSNMSHEIRTPMNAIIGLDSIALNEPDLPERTREHLEKIGTSAQHLLSIINDILDMSRIESGRMTLKSEEFSFSKALEQVNTIISGQCRDKKLEYECRIKGVIDDYYIGDDMKLRQIMINILSNAVKFTPEGGSVTFTVEETARLEDKSTLQMTIADTGIGMSPEYLPKLFDAFSQEDSSTTNKYGSTGLGMPIMKNLVEMMNGHVEVESKKDEGTTFTVMVTLTRSGRKDRTMPEGEIQTHELSILVIDDDPVACEHAQIVMGQVGIDCDVAGSGAEGLRMVEVCHARRDPYHLILVDWKMPEMDGVETTRRIREVVGNETPIIILTSYHWDDVAEEAREAGVDSFVPKPLFAATVIDEFREAFRKKNLELMKGRADLKGRRILLAEDMMVNAEIMVMVLAMREIEAEVAENGRIALEMVEDHEPGYYDAVLMDMRMPEMDGLEATRRIRALDREDVKTLPIIALTANAFDEDVQRSMQAGLNAHLSKPVEPEALFETLESLIGHRENAGE
ncbi:MAG: response regulator, partial [Firmicutes bacterium]|nr:response regulator [Bacillota bacterium]